ncbi:hypothetical protein DAQ1742_03538 [Dickeya aquatica]|uniref:Uncharacterized protein n=1 Tax=Dickeya aquatica TaxID=1401087 RepID=A0A375AE22_9GAMM|nr:hypothetical protein DAQ1742_03538 [Dickeya aquatica]
MPVACNSQIYEIKSQMRHKVLILILTIKDMMEIFNNQND